MKLTKSFYSSVNNVDKQCKVLAESSSVVTYERRLLYPETYSNDSNLVKELTDNYEAYSKDISSTDSTSQKLSELGVYFNGFTFLFPMQKTNANSPVYDRRVLSAIENFSSYLPFGIGLTIYKTLYDLVSYTSRFIKIPHSRKMMKNYVIQGNNQVRVNSDYVLKELQTISINLKTEKELIKQNYLKFLSDQKVNKSPSDYYLTYNPIFLKKYHLASSSLELSDALIEAIPDIVKAYEVLYVETHERERIKKEIPEFINMYKTTGNALKHYAIVNEALKANKSY